jgi:hypothetical protein
MREESAISIFRKLPETKAQVKRYGSLIKASVLNGEVDPLVFAAQVQAIKKLIEDISGDILIKDAILAEAEKYGKSFEQNNAKFQIKETGVKYDFARCNDVNWEELSANIETMNAKKKDRENFLKSITPSTVVFGADGVQIMPPVKSSSTGVTITLND